MLVGGDIVCWDTKFVEVKTERGAWYMMLLAILEFMYTLVIIVVFYEVPKRCFHQFRQKDFGFLEIGQGMRVSQRLQDQQVKVFFNAV